MIDFTITCNVHFYVILLKEKPQGLFGIYPLNITLKKKTPQRADSHFDQKSGNWLLIDQ